MADVVEIRQLITVILVDNCVSQMADVCGEIIVSIVKDDNAIGLVNKKIG